MIKILIVDDEIKIREMIRKYAQYEGFFTQEACNGIEAVDMALSNDFDCIVMDIMMPELDGFSACRQIRKEKNVPILMLSALGEEYDKIHGFDLGVDDYVVKPFSPKELMMRIKAILKRSKIQENDTFEIEGLKIDFSAHQVFVDGEIVQLSPKEYDLLCTLVNNRGIAMTREKLLQIVWGYDFFGDDRTLDTHIKLLRRNLKDYSKFIVTLRGVGYRFEKTI
ncbi:MAG: response regulator transcription factor [Erysipelotrichaceae bacterium]|nr:response regulator transcription factor [Erysipelotrichaceae bacterium]